MDLPHDRLCENERFLEHLQQQVSTGFTLTHLGMMGYDRNPKVLFQVLHDLKKEQPDFAKHLKRAYFA